MKRPSTKMMVFVVMAIAAIVTIGYLLYRSSHSSDRLDVEPHAEHEIQKAKKR
jgi:Tfp pilus assembly protein PilO